MTAVSSLLQRVEEAFTQGRDRPPQKTDASSGRLYGELFQASLNRGLPPEEVAYFGASMERQNEALECARQGRLEEAGGAFDQERERLQREPLSPAGGLFVQTFLAAAEAYLAYRRQDYGRARELVLQASALDRTLVDDFGFAMMSARRLHLGHNLLRIHTRQGERSAAVRLAAAFFDYLELRADTLPDTLASPRAVLDCVPEAIPDFYFDKFGGEVALVLAGLSGEDAEELFRPLARHTDSNGCLGTGFGADTHAWLHAKQLALRGGTETFLETAAGLLRLGRRAEPSLWFALVVEVASCCRSLGAEGAAAAGRMTAAPTPLGP